MIVCGLNSPAPHLDQGLELPQPGSASLEGIPAQCPGASEVVGPPGWAEEIGARTHGQVLQASRWPPQGQPVRSTTVPPSLLDS